MHCRFSALLLLGALLPLIVAAQNPPLRISAIASLSGPAAEQGKNWLHGAELAASDLRREGIDVELIVEDDASRPAQATTALQKLVSVHKIDALIGGTWDFLAEALSPLVLKANLPFVTPTNPVEILSESARRNHLLFTNGLSIAATRGAMARFLDSRPVKTVAVIVPNVPFGLAHAEMLSALAREREIQIQFSEAINYEGYYEILRALAQRLAHERPELIFLITDYAAMNFFFRELERLQFLPLILTTQHLDAAFDLSKRSGAAFERAFGIYSKVENAEFAALYAERFGSPPRIYAAEGYDALMFLARGLSQKVRFAEANGVEVCRGLLGPYVIRSDTRQIVRTNAVLMTTKDGRFAPAE